MNTYKWRTKWQPFTRGGFEVPACVRTKHNDGWQYVIIKNGSLTHSIYCGDDGRFNSDGTDHDYDLLPVEQPEYSLTTSIPDNSSTAFAMGQQISDQADTIAALTAELDRLRHYREQMECAHGKRIYAVDQLLEHFNENGTLKGDGQWRLREIYRSVKAFDESSHESARLADCASPSAELKTKLDQLTSERDRWRTLHGADNPEDAIVQDARGNEEASDV